MSTYRSLLAIGIAAVMGLARPVNADTGEVVFGITTNNQLVRFSAEDPSMLDDSVSITGLINGESVLSIDFRPQTNALVALGSSGRLYTINLETGAATQIGTGAIAIDPARVHGIDFNPTVDRIRIVTDAGANLRANPDTGALVSTDTNLSFPASGDANSGETPAVVSVAYSNSAPNVTGTALFGIDFQKDILVRHTGPAPSFDTLSTIGSLGVDATSEVGFDIATPRSGRALASITVTGEALTKLFAIDLGTGAARLLGTIGGTNRIRDIAIHRAGALSLEQATYSVAENGVSLKVIVERAGGSFGPYGPAVAAGTPTPVATPVTINLSTSAGTATANTDYTTTTTTLTFAEGEKSKEVTIPILDDLLVEGNETFTVSLTGETGGAIVSDTGASSVVILENDTPVNDGNGPVVTIASEESIARARFTTNGLPVDIGCSEGCSLTAELVINAATARKVGLPSAETVIGTATSNIAAAGTVTVPVTVSSQFKRSFRRLNRFFVNIRVTAKDASNNTTIQLGSAEVATVRR